MARDLQADNQKRRQYKTNWERQKYHSNPEYREQQKKKVIKNPVQPGDGDPRHGKASTYNNHRCRCDLCRAAINKYHQERE